MIEKIREKLNKLGLDAYVISHGNRFLNQDILPQEHKLKKVCGFTGSAGAMAVTKDKAFLAVDGRYELQAKKQVNLSEIQIINDYPRLKILCDMLATENISKIGYDSWNYSVAEMEFIKRKYRDIKFIDVGDLVETENKNIVEVFERSEKYSGMSTQQKIDFIIEKMNKKNADYQLFCSADSVSWLLNIYAKDLPYSPVVRTYALIDKTGYFCIFGENLITDLPLKNWNQLKKFLSESGGSVILYDPHTTPEKIKNLMSDDIIALKTEDICQNLKSVKNSTEIQGMINCHIRDGVALTKLLYWIENNYKEKTESDVVKKLHELHSKQELFFSESFETIAGVDKNSAIVHYQPSKKTDTKLSENTMFLLDSGSQYLDGTTDVTRTVSLGKPSEKMKSDFTYVLKAHIALAKAKFPLDVSGLKIDTLARAQIWNIGLDYKHGTGHGVACFGNVHEGPISISYNGSNAEFKENMVTSIEPGIYKENQYGIRIENLYYTAKSDNNSEFLEFIPLTLAPIDKKLIKTELLNNDEKEWLNNYNYKVLKTVSPYLDEQEKNWLKGNCSKI